MSFVTRLNRTTPLLWAIAFLLAAGCQPAGKSASSGDGHGHHHGSGEHPETYALAVQEVEELSNEIRLAFEAGKPDDAHDALHEVGHLLGELPKLARNEGLDDRIVSEVKENAELALAAFEKLDTAHFHKKAGEQEHADEVKYEDIAESITTPVEALAKRVVDEQDGDHEHAEHSDHDEHADHDGHADHDEDADHDEHAEHDADGEHAEEEAHEHADDDSARDGP